MGANYPVAISSMNQTRFHQKYVNKPALLNSPLGINAINFDASRSVDCVNREQSRRELFLRW